MASEKRCNRCKEVKSLDRFGTSKQMKDGKNIYCLDCTRAASAAYRLANPEKQREAVRRSQAKSRDKKNAKTRERYLIIRDQKLKNERQKRLADPEHVRQIERRSQKKWREANPEAYRAKIHVDNIRRRARLLGNGIYEVSAKDMRRLLAQSCAACGGAGEHVDHIVPVSRGGHHAIGNLQMLCKACNLSKHKKLSIEWRARKTLAVS